MKTKRYTKQFNSIADLSNFVDVNQNNMTTRGSMARYAKHDTALMSFDEAIKRGNDGGYWPEGAKQVEPVEMDLSAIHIHGLDMPRPEAAVIGYRPNVAAYLAGSPTSMVRMTPFHQPNRLIKVAVAVGKSYGLSADKSFNRGSGILSVLNALHAAGFSIELWALWRNADDNGNEVSIETLVKDSTDSYSPDSIAFTLCNDAFQRRLNWGALGILSSQEPDNEIINGVIDDSLGSGRAAKYEDFDLAYDWFDEGQRWTKEGSADRARGIAEDQLNKSIQSTGE